MYILLYGSAVNPYHNMRIDKSVIINNVLYMTSTISLPLKHRKAPIMSLYGLSSYYMPMNMSDYKKTSSAYTKISHPYLLLSDDQFALLDDNIDRNTIQYDHMYVQTTPIPLFRHTNSNCYVNIFEHAKAKVITSTCTFYTITTLLYMPVWSRPMTSSSS